MTAIFVAMPAGAQLGGFLGDQVGLSAVLVGYGLALATYAMLGGIALRGFTDLDGERSEDGSTLQTDRIATPDEPAAGKAAVE
jgi:hypothetical protein